METINSRNKSIFGGPGIRGAVTDAEERLGEAGKGWGGGCLMEG